VTGSLRLLSAVAPKDATRFVGRRPFLVCHELQAIVARVMRVAIESSAKVLEALDLPAGHGLEAAA